jgi:hypothetical protein
LFSYERAISDLDKINIAVIEENRGAGKGTEVVDLSAIRKELCMFPGNWDASIADLGTILAEIL